MANQPAGSVVVQTNAAAAEDAGASSQDIEDDDTVLNMDAIQAEQGVSTDAPGPQIDPIQPASTEGQGLIGPTNARHGCGLKSNTVNRRECSGSNGVRCNKYSISGSEG